MERSGTTWNLTMPMILKTVLVDGLSIYLAQLLVNLSRHFSEYIQRIAVLVVLGLTCLRLVFQILDYYGDSDGVWFGAEQWIAQSFSEFISAAIIIALMALMMTGMPLGVFTLVVSVICALIFFGDTGLYLVSTNAIGLLEKYPLVAVPFFVLMASISERAGIAMDLFDAMSVFAGEFRGGVALQTTVAAVIIAAMSGVLGGEVILLGLVALPHMFRLGYDHKLSTGLICASGALATLILPSIVMIVYGLSAGVGVGDLFLASIVPGLMLAAFYASFVLLRCSLNPSLAPTAAETAKKSNEETKLGRHQVVAVAMSVALILLCFRRDLWGASPPSQNQRPSEYLVR